MNIKAGMAEKKEALPSVTCNMPSDSKMANTDRWLRWSVLLNAVTVTLALATVCVFGVLYFKSMDAGAAQDYHKFVASQGQKYDLDLAHNKEVIHQRDQNGNITTMVLDFSKQTGGLSSTTLKYCLLLDDFSDVPDAAELRHYLEQGDDMSSPDTPVEYAVDTVTPVDLSRLPYELVEPCWGKKVYNLKRMDHSLGRVRRGDKWGITIHIGKKTIFIGVEVEG